MARLDWQTGRFSVDYETSEIYRGLRGWQRYTGDSISYYRFQYDQSSTDPVYGEAGGPMGRMYFGPVELPALHVLITEGENENKTEGFTYNDDAHVTASFDMLRRLGMNEMDINHQNFLKDRFVYNDKVFRVTDMQILGQIQRKDIIATIDATQVKPDELVNDIQFSKYADVKTVYPLNYDPSKADPQAMNTQLSGITPVLHDPYSTT